MTRVVDTSAWIELLTRSPLTGLLIKQLPSREECIVPTIVQLELAKWLNRELDAARANRFLAYSMKCCIVPLDTGIALRAARLGHEHRLSTADAVIYATAVEHGSDLLACDAHFKDLSGVIYYPKSS